MVRWMCNVKVKDTVPCKELRERIGTDDVPLSPSSTTWYRPKGGDALWLIVSDIAIFVLKRDVKLQLTNSVAGEVTAGLAESNGSLPPGV